MSSPEPGVNRWRLFAGLALVASLLQVLPFALNPVSHVEEAGLPDGIELLAPHYAPTDYAKAQAFNAPFLWSMLTKSATRLLALLALVMSGLAVRVEQSAGATRKRWPARLLFLAGLSVTFYLLMFPFRFCNYRHFLAFGLSDLSFAGWLRLLAITYPAGLCMFLLKYTLVFCMVRIFRERWWVAAAVVIFLTFGIIPEFFKNRPIHPEWELSTLPAGDHREAMAVVAGKAGVELEYMLEGRSKREKTANMMFCGHAARKYVVLTDTFLEQFSPAEAAVALAHELGHERRYVRFLMPCKLLGLFGLVVTLRFAHAVARPGKRKSPADLQVLPVVMLCTMLVGTVLGPLGSFMSRHDERMADRYALELTRDPDSFTSLLAKGARVNLEPIHAPAWYRCLFQGHPSVLERVRMARDWEQPE